MSLALKGSSRQAFAASSQRLETSLAGISAAEANQLSQELLFVASALSSTLSLRRALTDPSHSGEEKSSLAAELFATKISAKSAALIGSLVSANWSAAGDLADVIEWLGVSAEAYSAEQQNNLDRLEEELFRFSRIISANPELRAFLVPSASSSLIEKIALVDSLLNGRATASTISLISQVIANPRGRSIESRLGEFAQTASDRKNQVIAFVKTAQQLSEVQLERLIKSLSKQVGKNVRVNVEVDKSVVGGISIRFADELIDGTVVSRLAEAGRRLAS